MDYMSHNILSEAKNLEKRNNNDVSQSRRRKRKRVADKPKPLHELQQESLEEGLTTHIGEQNKGYQLLMKMGYKKGTGLGKERNGIQEPLPIAIRNDRSGVGDKEAERRSEERFNPKRLKIEEAKQTQFKISTKQKLGNKKAVTSIVKIVNQVCPQLDEQKGITENTLLQEYHQSQVITQKKTCTRCLGPLVLKTGRFGEFYACTDPICKYKCNIEDGGPGQGMDIHQYLFSFSPEEQVERLKQLLVYLRTTHHYCFYCGAIYDDEVQLEKMCPGLLEEDH